MLRRSRQVLIAVLAELGVSALFGAITFLGAFAHDLGSPRATIEGTLSRSVWLGFLVLAGAVAARLWLGLSPAAKANPAGYGYQQPSYGRPYPGQPLYPQQQSGFSSGTAAVPAGSQAPSSPSPALSIPTPVTGWPLVPPPPMPEPLVVPVAEATIVVSRVDVPVELPENLPSNGELAGNPPPNGELTQKLSAYPAAEPTTLLKPVVDEPSEPTDAPPTASTDAPTDPPVAASDESATQQTQRGQDPHSEARVKR